MWPHVHPGQWLKRGGILVFASWLFLLHQPISFLKAEPGFFGQGEKSLVRAELIPEFLWVEPGKTFSLWLKISIELGWHIYWKNPGEAGLPTTISWELPPGINLVAVSWPWPARFVDSLAICYGYSQQVLVLAQFDFSSQAAPPSPFRVRAEISYLVCREGCLPGTCSSQVSLEVKKAPPPENEKYQSLFLAGRQKLAATIPWPAAAEADETTIRIFFQPPPEPEFNLLGADFFIENEGIIDYSAGEKWEKEAGRFILSLKRAAASAELPPLIRGILVLKATSNQGREKGFSLEIPLKGNKIP